MPERVGNAVLAFGEILYDVFSDGAYLGGAPLNFAWYVRQFGLSIGMVSAVGNDVLGARALAMLRSVGIDCAAVQVGSLPTGTVDVQLTDGQPRFTINRGVAWDEITIDTAAIEQPSMLYYGTLAQRTLANRASLSALLALQTRHRFFDANLRQSYFDEELVLSSIQQATIVKLNEEELMAIQSFSKLNEPVEIVKRFGLAALVVTRGEHGASLYVGNTPYEAHSPSVFVVDTVGAGDAFSAVIAAAQLSAIPLDRVLGLACEVGAYVVTQRGAQTQLPTSLITAFEKMRGTSEGG